MWFMEKKPRKTLSVIKDRQGDKTKLPIVGEIADSRFVDLRNPPSLAALKLHTVMFKAAGGRIADDCWHEISLAELRKVPGLRKYDRADLSELLKELRGVVLAFDDYEHEETVVAGLLSIGKIEFERGPYNAPTMMRWKFDEGFRELVAKSNYWALIDRQTMLSMTSRYSLRLLEMMSLRVNLQHRTRETFTLADLRARLGVADGKLATWDHFRTRALDYAVAEVNQLSRFIVTTRPIKEGRWVVAVEFTWAEKAAPAIVATKRELDRPKIGRKARRAGTVETLAEPIGTIAAAHQPARVVVFPATRSIHYGKWGDLVRQHAPKPTPDVDRVADAFRTWTKSKQLKLNAATIEKAFVTFCKGFI